MSMTGDDVKRDFDHDYRLRVAQGAKEMLKGQDEPTNREIQDLYPEIRTAHARMPRSFQEQTLARKRREVQAAIVGMRLGVEPKDLLEIVTLLEGMEH